MTVRYLPSDVSSDIHQIIAKALFLREAGRPAQVILTRAEMERAAEAQFEYDVLDSGDLLFRKALDS